MSVNETFLIPGITPSFLDQLRKERPFELQELPHGVKVTLDCKLTLSVYYGRSSGGSALLQGTEALMAEHSGPVIRELASTDDLRESIGRMATGTTDTASISHVDRSVPTEEKTRDADPNGRQSVMIIGGDESGKGELWGPLVVAIVFASGRGVERITSYGKAQHGDFDGGKVRDSKRIKDGTPEGRRDLGATADFIRAEADHVETEIVSPGYIASQPKRSFNGVLLEAYEKCLSRASPRLTSGADLFIDDVGNSKHVRSREQFQRTARDHFGVRSLEFMSRGETKEKMIAAASIVARDLYLSRIDDLLRTLGQRVPADRPDLIAELDARKLLRARSCKRDALASYCIGNFESSFAYDWIKTSFGR